MHRHNAAVVKSYKNDKLLTLNLANKNLLVNLRFSFLAIKRVNFRLHQHICQDQVPVKVKETENSATLETQRFARVKIALEFTYCNLLVEGECLKRSPSTKLQKLIWNDLNLHLHASNKTQKFPTRAKHASIQRKCSENTSYDTPRNGFLKCKRWYKPPKRVQKYAVSDQKHTTTLIISHTT